ncbi:MAG: S9 family peptidase, partial [Bdellovibrio sp.]|nr:S9 family peptidase [Bdellovibrio sp.]
LEDFDVFRDFLVLQEKKQGLTQLNIIDKKNSKSHLIKFNDPTYSVTLLDNTEYETPYVRYVYESMTTPDTIYDYNHKTKDAIVKKEKKVLGGFKKENYESQRLWASSHDGTKIPLSIVYKKGIKNNGNNPLLIYGYGSYGISTDPSFSADALSLLDRGFIFAIAHIRGGSEMGRQWYEDGKLLKKKNTFLDFIACSEFLIQKRFTSSKHLYAMGGSAGGLLMGAILNLRPEIYNGVIADVPFVDVLTTMLDATIPLTTEEYDEWGNPNIKKYYDYIKSYSPYDNVYDNVGELKSYPNILVISGLHDSQVQYFEPTKWVAKLRATKKDQNLLLLRTIMDAGHSGKLGRFTRLKEKAEKFAFILSLEGLFN